MRWNEIVENKVNETATAGATGSGNVATVPGGRGAAGKGAIGAGFDPSGHKGIYDAAERKKKRSKAK
jgi:hypothetical protein